MTDSPRDDIPTAVLGVAEAKRRFSELIDRVGDGEQFVVSRRGKPAVAIVPVSSESMRAPARPPLGLAAGAGALSEWDELDEVIEEIYAARQAATDRPAPDLG
jgi:prevent-host-death family protein